jgi:hypothetical protein
MIVHIGAFVGTGFAALAMDPAIRLPATPGRSSLTALRVLWFGWPFLVSLGVSRALLPGKTLAIWLFVAILAAVTVVGGYFLDDALARGATRWEIFMIAVVEAAVLSYAARFLEELKIGP